MAVAAPAALGWLAAIVLLAGAAKGLTGFGGALVMAPLFGFVVSAPDAAALIVFVHALTSLQGVRRWHAQVRWRGVLALAAIALPCTALVAHGLDRLATPADAHALRRAIAVAVLAITLLHLRGWRWRHGGSPGALAAAGLASGALTALAGLGGPPAVYYLAGLDGGPALRANLLGYFAALFCGAALLFAASHRLGAPQAATGLVLAPVFALGVALGERAGTRLSSAAFDRLVSGLLLLSGGLALVG